LKIPISVTVNGVSHSSDVEPRLLLVHYLREVLELTGTHIGCETGLCGACTVSLDGEAVKSCMVLAVQANGCTVQTVESLAGEQGLDAVQRGFQEQHGLQCGFCTPGILMTAHALLRRSPQPSEEEIRRALSGNLCRCTGYQSIVAAIQDAAVSLQAAQHPARSSRPRRAASAGARRKK
jgi:aerobic carbon-monoxide dehydrogenase small subunit